MVENFYTRQVGRVVADLRRLADSIERSNVGTGSCVDAATYVVHDVMNALPNLPLSLLVQAGRDVDVWRAAHPAALADVAPRKDTQ